MIEYHPPNFQTVVFVIVFFMGYLIILLKNVIKNVIDLYDLLLLSSIAVVPAAFILFPKLFFKISNLLGISFPFVLMFGVLFFVLFAYLCKLVVTINRNVRNGVILIQEISILKQEMEKLNKNR